MSSLNSDKVSAAGFSVPRGRFLSFNQSNSTRKIKDLFVGHHNWVQFHLSYDKYFNMFKFYKLGFLTEAVFSTQNLFNNYTSSLLAAPAFEPIPESKTLFLTNYRAFQYGALGMKNIFVLFKQID